MSEFTSGVLFLKRDLESVNKASQNLMEKYVIQTLNDKWAALFSEQGNPREPIFAQWLASASKEVSLLCFEHAGDHGWGYLVFHDGSRSAMVGVAYELEWQMTMDLVEARYPATKDLISFVHETPGIFESLNEEVKSSQRYQNALHSQFAYKNVNELGLFDIKPTILAQVDALLTAEVLQDLSLNQVEQFKVLMGFPEMEWMSYHYVTSRS